VIIWLSVYLRVYPGLENRMLYEVCCSSTNKDYVSRFNHLIFFPPEPGPRVYIPQEQGGIGFPFRRLLWLSGLRWRYSNYLHTDDSHILFKLYCDRRSVDHFVSVSGPLWGLWPDFTFSLVWQVLVSSSRVPSLRRGRICSLRCNRSLVRVTQDP
jgi:hypothetical protein